MALRKSCLFFVIAVAGFIWPVFLKGQVSSNSPVCEGATLTFTNSTNGIGYMWSGPNGFFSTSKSPSITSTTLANDGIYTVAVINGPGDTTFISTTVRIVDVPSRPAVNGTYTACTGRPFTLFAADYNPSNGFTYSWNGPAFTSNRDSLYLVNPSAANAGAYTVSATNQGCSGPTASFNVNVRPKPSTPAIITQNTFCEDGFISLSYSGPGGFIPFWSGPNGFTSTQGNPSITPAAQVNAGEYRLTLIDPIGNCSSDTAKRTLTMIAAPPAPSIVGDTSLCPGDTLSLRAVPTGTATGYLWLTPNTSVTTQTLVINNVGATDDGLYSVTYNNGQCNSKPRQVMVRVNPKPMGQAINATNGTVYCENSTLELTTTLGPNEGATWIDPSGGIDTNAVFTLSNLTQADSGLYRLVIRGSGCSSDTSNIAIQINKTPRAPGLTTNAPVCARTQLLVMIDSLEAGVTYEWRLPDGSTITDTIIDIAEPMTSLTGNFTLNGVLGNCVSADTSIYVRIKGRVEPFGPFFTTPICENYFYTSDAGGYEEAEYIWSGPQGFLTNERYFNIDSIKVEQAGNYTIKVRNSCDTVSFTQNVVVVPSPKVEIVGPNTICFYETRKLDVESNEAVTVLWTDSVTSLERIITEPGDYGLTAFNFLNCSTKVKPFTVELLCEPKFFIPNAFTPDGDNLNDKFEIKVENLVEYNLEIFDRLGQLVFSSTDPYYTWDGRVRGNEVLGGIYVYNFEYKGFYKNEFFENRLSGTVMVLTKK